MCLLNRMHRQPEHVMTFLLAEMGTSGSLDGQQRLVVKGRFAPKNFEGILRRYVSKFFLSKSFLAFVFGGTNEMNCWISASITIMLRDEMK